MDLQDSDVIHMENNKNLGDGATSRISEIRQKIKNQFPGYPDWISDDGAECELLREGGRWQAGRIRLRLEFVPEDEDSPLEELRSDLNI
ncbi:KGK domain-containing protein [Anabaena sp. CCY 0017]|uniref:KGK domain-containing protein n=1 Tax=Anabaena sp. CCY 0017 TaxID=3103866 RepID=UPI0039C61B58